MQEIAHGLWISDIDGVRRQPTNRFDLVVSVCQDTADDNVGGDYDHYVLADGDVSAEDWGGSARYGTFSDAAHGVTAALRDDDVEEMVVHCHSGQNRSAAVCSAALAVYTDSTFDEALADVKSARPIANPTRQMAAHGRRFVHEQ